MLDISQLPRVVLVALCGCLGGFGSFLIFRYRNGSGKFPVLLKLVFDFFRYLYLGALAAVAFWAIGVGLSENPGLYGISILAGFVGITLLETQAAQYLHAQAQSDREQLYKQLVKAADRITEYASFHQHISDEIRAILTITDESKRTEELEKLKNRIDHQFENQSTYE